MHFLFISTLFPNSVNPTRALYNLRHLTALRKLGHRVDVIAPVPWFPGLSLLGRRYPPKQEMYEGFRVSHPRFLAPPRTMVHKHHLFYRRAVAAVVERWLREDWKNVNREEEERGTTDGHGYTRMGESGEDCESSVVGSRSSDSGNQEPASPEGEEFRLKPVHQPTTKNEEPRTKNEEQAEGNGQRTTHPPSRKAAAGKQPSNHPPASLAAGAQAQAMRAGATINHQPSQNDLHVILGFAYPDAVAMVPVCRKLGLNFSVFVLGSDFRLRIQQPKFRGPVMQTLRDTPRIFCPGQALRNDMIAAGLEGGRIFSFNNGVDTAVFHP